MSRRVKLLLALVLGFCCYFSLGASEIPPLQAALLSEQEMIVPGQDFDLVLEVKLAPDWHVYWKNPGDAGMAPSIEWGLPKGVTLVGIEWPVPERFEQDDSITFGYSEKAPFLVKLHADQALSQNSVEIKGTLQWVVCSKDTCLPGTSEFATKLSVGNVAHSTKNGSLFTDVRQALPKKVAAKSVKQEANQLLVAFNDDEIAMNETPLFFPEEGSASRQQVTMRKQSGEHLVTIPHSVGQPLKGILVVGEKAYVLDEPNTAREAQHEVLSLFMALLFAFLGGLLLNLMPCVLPVISLKVMSFVKMAGESRKELTLHGLSFTMGVLISFWTLAIVLILLQKGGQAVGWGFQLQEPLFIAALALLFTLLGLSLFGVFEMGTQLASYAGEASLKSRGRGLTASFTSGIFATAVATPCTGPFMGSALGYALTQPAYVSLAIFTTLGLGMSLPYLLLGAFPALIRWLPKPGAWMETFKQFLGFFMLATVIWLLWVFGSQTGNTALFLMLFALLASSISAWIYGHFGSPLNSPRMRRIAYIASGVLLLGSFTLAYVASQQTESVLISSSEEAWEPFSAERLAELRASNTPVLIDFTAKWCLVCQANHLVLSHRAVEQKFNERGVVRMKADWTRYDPAITAELRKHGRSGVPLYVLYHGDSKKEATILPQVLTPDIVMNSLDTVNYVR